MLISKLIIHIHTFPNLIQFNLPILRLHNKRLNAVSTFLRKTSLVKCDYIATLAEIERKLGGFPYI